MKGSAAKYLPYFFLTLLGLTVLTAVMSFRNISIIQSDTQWVFHSREVITQSEILYSSVRDAESEARGYFVSNNPDLLLRYKNAKKQISQNYKSLYILTGDNPDQKKLLIKIQGLITQRTVRLDNLVMLFQKEGISAIQQQTDGSPGITIMNAIVQSFHQFDNSEQNLLAKRRADLSKSLFFTYVVIGVTSFLLIIFVYLAYFMTKRELQLRENLEQQKDQFINMASHELKTPLTSLRVFSQVLRKRLVRYHDHQLENIIDKIDIQILRTREMIEDLLDLSRIQTGKLMIKKERFNLYELAAEVVEVFAQTTVKHTITMTGKKKAFVYADRYRIYQVLVNFMTNAIKYSPQGGKIHVRVRNRNRTIELSVTDKGVGIEEKDKQRIFNKLYQVREGLTQSVAGLGIGLYIASEIIKNHGGKIWVESKKGEGSSFFFTLQKPRARKIA